MNNAHYHLLVNHIPIIFPVAGILILIASIFLKNKTIEKVAYSIFIVGAIATLAAMQTGERAEDVIEQINNASKNYMHNHEEWAEKFAAISYALGALSLIGLFIASKQNFISSIYKLIVLVFAFITMFFAKQTGTSGGEISHPEIRQGNALIINNAQSEKEED